VIWSVCVSAQAEADDVYGGYENFEYRLIVYERLRDVASLLELAVWKAKIRDNDVCAEQQAQGRINNCGAEFIIPHVLTFLVGVKGKYWVNYRIKNEYDSEEVTEKISGIFFAAADDYGSLGVTVQ
jgi:hypothetical protein